MTQSMRPVIPETDARRNVQVAYKAEHGLTSASIVKQTDDVLSSVCERDYMAVPAPEAAPGCRTQAELDAHVAGLERHMRDAAANLDFETVSYTHLRAHETRHD